MFNFLKNKRIYIPFLIIIAFAVVTISYILLTKDNVETKTPLYKYTNNFEDPWDMPGHSAFRPDESEFTAETEIVKEGSKSVAIESPEQNDARYEFNFYAKKNMYYKFSCWIKTEDVGTGTTGANISIEGEYDYTFGDLRGTNDWTYVEGYIDSHNEKAVKVWLRLGGYSNENSGKVYFDDFKIEEMKEMPAGTDKNNVHNLGESFNTKEYQYVLGYILLFIIISLILLLTFNIFKNSTSKLYFQGETALFIIFAVAFAIRLIAAPFAQGFEGDVGLFKKWGDAMATNVSGFYDIVPDCDYPPFYMYILGFIGKIMQVFNIELGTYAYKLAIKLPPLIADMISAFFIYKICNKVEQGENGKWMKPNWKVFFTALYLFNPMVLFDSVVWGQMDSFLALFVVLAVYAVMNERVITAALLFGTAIVIKPQGLFAGPVLLYYVLKEGTIKNKLINFAKSAVTIIMTILLITLPYTIKNIFFITDLMVGTTGHYPYASVNGFNLFTLLGLNWVNDSEPGLFRISHYVWGMGFLALIVITGFLLYILLPKDYKVKPMLIALYLVMGVFTFSIRMHERYFFPAILLALIVAIYDNSKFMMKIYWLITATAFFNSLLVLGKYNSGQDIWFTDNPISIMYISAGSIAAFVLVTVYIILKIRNYNGAKLLEEVQADES